MHVVKAVFAVVCLFALSAAANAQSCSFSMTNIDFGSQSFTTGGNTSTSGTLTANCSGTANQTVEICANFGTGSGGSAASGDPRYLKNGSSQIEYSILRANGAGQIWGSYLWPYSSRPPSLSIRLGANGQGSLTRSVNARARVNQPAASTGIHTSVFSGSNALFDYGYSPGFTCSAATSGRAVQVPFTALVNNTASCTLAATDMSFGNVSNLTTAINATSTITATCTKGTAYNLGLSNGSGGGTTPTARRMTNGSTASFVTYGIYRNAARTQPWGNTVGTDTATGRGNGNTQAFTAYGRVPAQASPESFTYTDTIIATITY